MPEVTFTATVPAGALGIHEPGQSREITVQGITTAMFAAKRAADAFDLDDDGYWLLTVPQDGGAWVLEDDELMADHGGQTFQLFPGPGMDVGTG